MEQKSDHSAHLYASEPMWTTPRILRIGLLLLILGASNGVAEERRFERAERQMGTKFSIQLYSESEQQAHQAFESAFARIQQLNEILSDYRADSEISRLSAPSTNGPERQVSDALWEVLSRGQQISRMSEGAFDMTLGPVTTLWRDSRRSRQLPDRQSLQQAIESTGYRNLRLIESPRSVSLTRPGMRLDLGGIAKGFALDEAMIELKRVGIQRALINGGGDLIASEPPPDARGWRIGLVGLSDDAPPSEFVWLANLAIATSGDLWQFVEIDGVRYSHLINPKTGIGLTQSSSVTVIAPTAMDADAIASAVSVLGPKDGLKLLKRHPRFDGRIVHKQGGAPTVLMTQGFEALVDSQPPAEAD